MDFDRNHVVAALVVGGTLYVAHKVLSQYRHLRRLPPGPIHIPFLGGSMVNRMSAGPHVHFQRFSYQYGPVFSLTVGPSAAVVVNGWPAVKEAVGKEVILARPQPEIFKYYGIATNIVDGSGAFGVLSVIWLTVNVL